MAETNILDIIQIVVSRLNQSKDSNEVFKSVLNLSIASKSCKKYLNDKLLIEISYRYIRDRTWFAISKLKIFIRSNDFKQFEILADLFVERFTRLESVRKLNSLLIYIVEHASCDFLQSYLTFFSDRGLHCGSIRQQQQPNAIYPDFRPTILMDAIRIADKNGWQDKLQLLLCRMLTFSGINTNEHADLAEKTIKNKNGPFNYDVITRYLMELYHNKRSLFDICDCSSLLESMTEERVDLDDGKHLVKVTKELLQLPIEKQPWFFGHLTEEEVADQWEKKNVRTRNVFLVRFYGSRLFRYRRTWNKTIFTENTVKQLPEYGLKNDGKVMGLDLYQFYLRLVAQDLDGMKELQENHKFDWPEIVSDNDKLPYLDFATNSQPHPLIEYLNVVDDIRQDIVDWLFELCPVKNVRFDWERDDMTDQQMQIVERIVELGGRFSANLIIKYITKAMPTNVNELKILMDNESIHDQCIKIWNFVLDEYRNLCKQRRIITDTKMAILLAWKHADGESIGFRNLPKDIIQLIVDLIDELPLVSQFAQLLPKRLRFKLRHRSRIQRSLDWFKNNLWGIELFASNNDLSWILYDIVESLTTNGSYSMFKKAKKWVLMLVIQYRTISQYYSCGLKFMKFMFKYETDLSILEKYFKYAIYLVAQWHKILSVEALKSQNQTSIKFLKSYSAFVMPTKEEFEQQIKPKHNLTYEKALKLVKESI